MKNPHIDPSDPPNSLEVMTVSLSRPAGELININRQRLSQNVFVTIFSFSFYRLSKTGRKKLTQCHPMHFEITPPCFAQFENQA